MDGPSHPISFTQPEDLQHILMDHTLSMAISLPTIQCVMKTGFLPITGLILPSLMIHGDILHKEDIAFWTSLFIMFMLDKMFILFISKETVPKYKHTSYLWSGRLFLQFHGASIFNYAINLYSFCFDLLWKLY